MGLLDTIGEALDRPWAAAGMRPEEISASPWARRGMVLSALGSQIIPADEGGHQNFYGSILGAGAIARERNWQDEQRALALQQAQQRALMQQQVAATLNQPYPGPQAGLQGALGAPGLGAPGPTLQRASAAAQMPQQTPAQFRAEQYRKVAGQVAAVNPEAAKTYLEMADKLDPRPDQELMAVAPGASVISKANPTRAVFTAPDKEKEINPNQPFMLVDGQIVANPAYQEYELKKAALSRQSISVDNNVPVAGVDANGQPVFVAIPKGMSGIIPGVRPPKSATEEKAEQERALKGRQASQMIATLNDAEQILKANKATASGLGTVRDAAGRAVGVSTAGAQEAARLTAMSGWLVSNVPRMEGPQSNYDVQNYVNMAGKIGDSTAPAAERLAALREVRKLQQKYAAISGAPVSGGPPGAPPAPAMPTLDDLLNKYGR